MKKSINTSAAHRGMVYTSEWAGHRGPHVELFTALLDFEGLCQPAGFDTLRRLIATPRLFLPTFDDDLRMFALAVAARAILGRPTVGVFMSPHRCFVTSELKSRLKKIAFKVFKRVPKLTLVTITPFEFEPRFAEVANVSAHDPQYWDLHNGTSVQPPAPTELSDSIIADARGRPVVILPGSLNLEKGFKFLAETLASSPGLADRVLVVAAGKVLANASAWIETFVANGGKLVNRRLEDAEIESLYLAADAIWCCYQPNYDQASGIFGRALQLGVPVIVRRGSLIEAVAAASQLPFASAAFADTSGLAQLLSEPLPERIGDAAKESHGHMIGRWRTRFLDTIKIGLRLPQ